jgi:hypothetical protein
MVLADLTVLYNRGALTQVVALHGLVALPYSSGQHYGVG